MIKLAVIGCGAVTRELHLSAVTQAKGVEVTHLVDINLKYAQQAKAMIKSAVILTDYKDVTDVDGVLIATPHYLHTPISEFFLEKGVHVLCEKPLALTTTDARRLVAVAAKKNLVLATGVFRRYYPANSFMCKVVKNEWLGEIESVDAEEGDVYDWNLQSAFMMNRRQAGGGVLIDTGSHTVDRIISWFDGGEISATAYRDNAYGDSVEADCELEFEIKKGSRVIPVRVELSRTRRLRNTFIIRMKDGFVETPVNDPYRAFFADKRLQGDASESKVEAIDLLVENLVNIDRSDKTPFFMEQIKGFVEAIKYNKKPLNDSASVLRTVELIENAYKIRQPMGEPWVHVGLNSVLLRGGDA